MLLLAACGGGGAQVGATFSGTVKGQPFTPADAQSTRGTATFSVGTAGVGAIALTSFAGVCASLTANTEPKSTTDLVLLVSDVNLSTLQGSAPTQPATYTVYDFSGSGLPPAHLAYVSYGVNDASCVEQPGLSATGKSGTVTLTRVQGGAYSGSFDVTFDSGDHATGTFDTAECPGFASYLGTSTHGCG
ncbi:MAG TPA: hypothetical protein VLW85_22880 [Myxococcales bacterium]|nr:hypothetical protein [Myxococcales bacterium]